jgi:uncharacterized phage infection (PIP) family protein YhgE
MNWLKKNWKTLLVIILAIVVIYLIFPKYDFLVSGDLIYKCNKITGRCSRVVSLLSVGRVSF